MSLKCMFTQRREQYVHFIILFQCTADQTAICTLSVPSELARATRSCAFIFPGALCKFIIYFSCRSHFPPSFFPSLLLSEVTSKSLGLFRNCLFLIAPVASLLLLVAVIIWFSHFPICCNNFILSHTERGISPNTPCDAWTENEARNDAVQPSPDPGSVHKPALQE